MSIYATSFFNDATLRHCPTKGIRRREQRQMNYVLVPSAVNTGDDSPKYVEGTTVTLDEFVAKCKTISPTELSAIQTQVRKHKIKLPKQYRDIVLGI